MLSCQKNQAIWSEAKLCSSKNIQKDTFVRGNTILPELN